MKNFLGTILIVVGLTTAILVFARSVTHYNNDEDTGVVLGSVSTSSAGTTSSDTSSVTSSDLPSRLQIPKLNIDANVQSLGITRKGNMAAPNNFTDVSWYKLGTVPGLKGSSVMAGHEDNAISLDGVFKHLDQLSVGDDVYVVTNSGKKLHFRVTGTKIFPYDLTGADLVNIFHATDAARLNLITCAGHWIQSAKTNDKRLVVYTELVK